MQSTNVNDAELAMVQRSWEQSENIHSLENALLMERATSESTIKKMRESREEFNHIADDFVGVGTGGTGISSFDDVWKKTKQTYESFMWHVSWSYSDELKMLQNDQFMLETIRTIETNGSFNPACSNMMNQLGVTNQGSAFMGVLMLDPDLRWLFSEDISVDANVFPGTMTVEVARRVVVTAIALKRYWLKHGDYPENLGVMVPEFMAAVPLDPVDGKLLRYHRDADGTFALYSVGPNGKDDGGDPSATTGGPGNNFYWLYRDARDWVWPQPATKAEIEYFYAHPPK